MNYRNEFPEIMWCIEGMTGPKLNIVGYGNSFGNHCDKCKRSG